MFAIILTVAVIVAFVAVCVEKQRSDERVYEQWLRRHTATIQREYEWYTRTYGKK